jgi:hypothetical protein
MLSELKFAKETLNISRQSLAQLPAQAAAIEADSMDIKEEREIPRIA